MAEPGDSAGAPGSAIISLVGGDLHPQHDDGEAARVSAPGPDAPVDFAPDRQPSAGWAWLEERLESAEVQAEGSAQAEAPPAKSANTGQLESPVAELESPMSPERRKLEGYPGHHTHTLNQPRPWSRHRIDRHHEATLPALSPGGTLRSPGGREVTRGQGGRLMSPRRQCFDASRARYLWSIVSSWATKRPAVIRTIRKITTQKQYWATTALWRSKCLAGRREPTVHNITWTLLPHSKKATAGAPRGSLMRIMTHHWWGF